MKKISKNYPQYLFENNKGYGTPAHRESIEKHGLTDIHRRSFNLEPNK